eukprot:CAMPEP_0206808820 /NCGR_PEP_ID=MMETSP0975-20121206/5934_1 /ASSEMBLY_ACC=CAM_ASM_000399 /TAXON_ID=483370 /ORGANISM="non described non described, Strain CCMP2097" /LENGTH=133 /DNA_ID=CAMNT_0054350913 /DNA_START=220 /DNA_END=619 /DNA_ORIENTATION=+
MRSARKEWHAGGQPRLRAHGARLESFLTATLAGVAIKLVAARAVDGGSNWAARSGTAAAPGGGSRRSAGVGVACVPAPPVGVSSAGGREKAALLHATARSRAVLQRSSALVARRAPTRRGARRASSPSATFPG